MSALHRKQWLATAARFPKMSQLEQDRVTRRMHDWVKLTPEQRAKARENYIEFSRLPPEQKEAIKKKWVAYKNLPTEEDKQEVREQHKSAILLAPPPEISSDTAAGTENTAAPAPASSDQ